MSDYTNIIQEINTNIPDNTDQAITALKVRTTLIDMIDAVDDNMTEAIGEISVPTKTSDLTNDSGFITASALDGYVTESQLTSMSYVTESQLQQAGYATETYVADYVASHSGPIDLSAYVTHDELQLQLSTAAYVDYDSLQSYLSSYVSKDELSQAGYVTQTQLSANSYATTAFVDDAIADAVVELNIPTKTSDLTNDSGFITATSLEPYVTNAELNSASYVTQSALNNMGYATTTELNTAISGIVVPTKTSDLTNDSGFITSSALPTMSDYVSKTELSQAGYITSIPSDYITESELDSMGYITSSALPTMSDYVSKTELSQAGYITSIPSDYITESELDSMGYITSSALPIMSDYVSKTELSAAGYLTAVPSEYVTESQLQSTLTAYITETELSAAGYITSSYAETYYLDRASFGDYTSAMQDTLVDANILITDPETGDWTPQAMASETYVAEYVATYAPTPDLSAYVTKSQLNQELGSYVTKTELSNAGYLTSIPSEYITDTELSGMGYITSSDLPDMSAYVTKTELSNAGYLTSIPNTYATYDAISAMGYITSSDLPDMSAYATITYVETYYATNTALGNKQDTLVSGTNIKTINNESLLGSGDITISEGGGDENEEHVLTFVPCANYFGSAFKLGLYRQGSDKTNLPDAVIQYKLDTSDWADYTIGTELTVGKQVKFRGINEFLGYSSSNYHYFYSAQNFIVYGDISSLCNKYGGSLAKQYDYQFYGLFKGFAGLQVKYDKNGESNLNLPVIHASQNNWRYAGSYMFANMFENCTGLRTMPHFNVESSLTTNKVVNSITAPGICYQMFKGCTSLTDVDISSIYTSSQDGGTEMFKGCTGLKHAKMRIGTNFFGAKRMFSGCTGLTQFEFYTSGWNNNPLNNTSMFENVNSTGQFYISKNDTRTDYSSYLPANWTVIQVDDDLQEYLPLTSYSDNGKGLQVVNGAWQKVSGLLTSANLIYDSTTNTLTINV